MADPDRAAEERLTGAPPDGGPRVAAGSPGCPPGRPLLPADLAAQLSRWPWSGSFHALLRRLERRHRDHPPFGAAATLADELPIRFGQDPSLSFPPAELNSWREPGERPARIGQLFFGLFGPHGPLPLHLTDLVLQRLRANDPTLASFADLFHHRLLCLLHRAWARARPVLGADRLGEDPHLGWIAALFGGHGSAVRGRDAAPDLAKLHFAGILANQGRHPEGLAALIAEVFGTSAEIVEFVGEWIEVPGPALFTIGAPRRLGLDTTLGRRYWSAQHKFRLVLGPLPHPLFRRLLPDGPDWPVLAAWVRNAVGDELDWDLDLLLRASDAPAFELGREHRLGWTTTLPGGSGERPQRVRIDPRRASGPSGPTAPRARSRSTTDLAP
jgi:type VI secretion system protein ImpH